MTDRSEGSVNATRRNLGDEPGTSPAGASDGPSPAPAGERPAAGERTRVASADDETRVVPAGGLAAPEDERAEQGADEPAGRPGDGTGTGGGPADDGSPADRAGGDEAVRGGDGTAGGERTGGEPSPPDKALTAEAGRRLADRYRLEARLSANQDTVTWRAVDEKLRRAVGIHLISGGTERARAVIAAARSAALVGDPRFVQVLDAAEWDGIVYVVKEWLPDADNLTSLLATTPLPPHETYALARTVSEAMAVAHRSGLSHLRLDPENVLRMRTGQYKIVGLGVEASLYGHTTGDAAGEDTRAIGALVYAALTRRWPGRAAYGLPEAPAPGGRLASPGQVRAGVDAAMEAVAMRALGHEYAHDAPFGTPQEVADAVAALPPVLPPEPETDAAVEDYAAEYGDHPVFAAPPAMTPPPPLYGGPPAPPPALGGGFGRVAKGLVALIVLVVVVLLTWQLALYVNERGDKPKSDGATSAPTTPASSGPAPGTKIPVAASRVLAPQGGDGRGTAADTHDGNLETSWRTSRFDDDHLYPYKAGLGIVYDFGKPVDLRTVEIDLLFRGGVAAGGKSTQTVLDVRAAPKATRMPSQLSDFAAPAATVKTATDKATATFETPLHTRFVLVWLTDLPYVQGEDYSGAGLKNGITEVRFTT